MNEHEHDVQLHSCCNSLCDRRTTAMFCCGPCALAAENHYEIHEDGLLGHSEGCDERHARRLANRGRNIIRRGAG